jgi:hypothetical protein
MDEQQLRGAVVAAANERLAELQFEERTLIQQTKDIAFALEEKTGELRGIQGRIAECLYWMEQMQTGVWREVEVPDEPEEG